MDVQSLEMAPLLDLFGPDAHHLGRTGHDDAGQLLSFNDALNMASSCSPFNDASDKAVNFFSFIYDVGLNPRVR